MSELPLRVRAATFLRSFAVQGSWNFRTMIGGGFAFALLPVLRHVHRDDPEALERALRLHAEHFNAHPYLVTLALGAVARMEAEGGDPEAIRRFKKAVRGPLGSLGDRLIWVTWLPVCALTALAAALLGLGPAAAVVTFLVLYNAVHLGLRLWGFRLGMQEGRRVGARLQRSPLQRLADRLAGPAVCLVGIVLGTALTRGALLPGAAPWLWLPAAAVFFLLGLWSGQDSWKWTAFLTWVVVAALLGIGAWA